MSDSISNQWPGFFSSFSNEEETPGSSENSSLSMYSPTRFSQYSSLYSPREDRLLLRPDSPPLSYSPSSVQSIQSLSPHSRLYSPVEHSRLELNSPPTLYYSSAIYSPQPQHLDSDLYYSPTEFCPLPELYPPMEEYSRMGFFSSPLLNSPSSSSSSYSSYTPQSLYPPSDLHSPSDLFSSSDFSSSSEFGTPSDISSSFDFYSLPSLNSSIEELGAFTPPASPLPSLAPSPSTISIPSVSTLKPDDQDTLISDLDKKEQMAILVVASYIRKILRNETLWRNAFGERDPLEDGVILHILQHAIELQFIKGVVLERLVSIFQQNDLLTEAEAEQISSRCRDAEEPAIKKKVRSKLQQLEIMLELPKILKEFLPEDRLSVATIIMTKNNLTKNQRKFVIARIAKLSEAPSNSEGPDPSQEIMTVEQLNRLRSHPFNTPFAKLDEKIQRDAHKFLSAAANRKNEIQQPARVHKLAQRSVAPSPVDKPEREIGLENKPNAVEPESGSKRKRGEAEEASPLKRPKKAESLPLSLEQAHVADIAGTIRRYLASSNLSVEEKKELIRLDIADKNLSVSEQGDLKKLLEKDWNLPGSRKGLTLFFSEVQGTPHSRTLYPDGLERRKARISYLQGRL